MCCTDAVIEGIEDSTLLSLRQCSCCDPVLLSYRCLELEVPILCALNIDGTLKYYVWLQIETLLSVLCSSFFFLFFFLCLCPLPICLLKTTSL